MSSSHDSGQLSSRSSCQLSSLAGTDSCSSASVELFGTVLSLVIQNPEPNALQDAATFAALLCVNKQLQDSLLLAAVNRIQLQLSSHRYDRLADRKLQWLEKHVVCGTLKCVDVLSSYQPFNDSVAVLLTAAAAAAAWSRELATEQQLLGAPQTAQPKALARNATGRSCFVLTAPQTKCWSAFRLTADTMPPSACDHLTTLKLRCVGPNISFETVNQLAALTNLRELDLPRLHPPKGQLAPALAALTRLTKLYIRHPPAPEQRALPASLRKLTVATQSANGPTCAELLPLKLWHLTELRKLTVLNDPGWQDARAVLTVEWILPRCLEDLEVPEIASCDPLLLLKQLTALKVEFEVSAGVAKAWPSHLPALQHVQLLQRPLSSAS